MTENLPAAQRPTSGEIEIFHPTTVFDTERYEQVNRVAMKMAHGSLIPDHLKGDSIEQAEANCFLICNLSATWGLDPFAVAQASALVFGKIVLEGKLVRTVIKKFLGFDLSYAYFGAANDIERRCYVSELPLVHVEENGERRALDEQEILELMETGARITVGTFAKWHTRNKQGGVNDNWAKDEPKMFRERGSREWCREWSPGLMLGVYTPDEFDEAEHTSRSNSARDVSPSNHNPLLDPGAQSGATAKPASPGPKGDEPKASAKPADAGGAGQSTTTDRPQPDPNAARVTADVWTAYHQALARMTTAENVEKAHKAFWTEEKAKEGFVPVQHPDDVKLGGDIKNVHQQRAKGEITDANYVETEVLGWIKKTTGGDPQ